VPKVDVMNIVKREVLIYTYRYCSLFLTSLYYLLADNQKLTQQKLTVIFFVVLAAQLANWLYLKTTQNRHFLMAAVFAETLGITFLLMPTGGLESPFIWYALNPVLVAGLLISPYFCWIVIGAYIMMATFAANSFFNQGYGLYQALLQNSGLILVFVLITLVVQLLAEMINELKKKSLQLAAQSSDLQRAIGHIMSLYKIVETVNTLQNLDKLIISLTEYAAVLTGGESSFFWQAEKDRFICDERLDPDCREDLRRQLSEKGGDLALPERVGRIRSRDKLFIATAVRSTTRYYGWLGSELSEKIPEKEEDKIRLLMFLGELSAVVFERLYLNEVADSIIVLEEQNRIANEMHDNIAQRLFSISCGLHVLETKWPHLEKDRARKQLQLIGKGMNEVMQELRSIIYHMSVKKTGRKSYFFKLIKSYLDDAAACNSITIEQQSAGDEELLSSTQKNALYRIILEAVGNAIRHGECRTIRVILAVGESMIRLTVEDDGKGFVPGQIPAEKAGGLGLANMRNLTVLLGGSFDIKSRINGGTTLRLLIPLRHEQREPASIQKGGAAVEAGCS